MSKRFILFTAETCVYCKPQKELLKTIPEAEDLIEYKDILENRDFCISKGIRSVPAVYDTLNDKSYIVGLYTIDDWKKLLEI